MKRKRKAAPRRRATRAPPLAAELAPFKVTEKLPVGGAVADDRDVRRVLAAWAMVPMGEWEQPRRARPADIRERWMWIWEGVYVDHARLAVAAGLATEDARRAFGVVVALRLAFPDGTISDTAQAILLRPLEVVLKGGKEE